MICITMCNSTGLTIFYLLIKSSVISPTPSDDRVNSLSGQRKIKCFTFPEVSKSPLCTWWMPSKHHQHPAGKWQPQARVQTPSNERQEELLTPGQVLSSAGSVRSAGTAFHVRWWLNHCQGYTRPNAVATTLHLIFQQSSDWQHDLFWEKKRKHYLISWRRA